MPGKFAPKGKGKSPLSISERIANVESEIADNAVTGGSVWRVIRQDSEFPQLDEVIAIFDSFDDAAAFRYELVGRRDSEFRFTLTNVAITEFYL